MHTDCEMISEPTWVGAAAKESQRELGLPRDSSGSSQLSTKLKHPLACSHACSIAVLVFSTCIQTLQVALPGRGFIPSSRAHIFAMPRNKALP
jgi:hypothetical protein